MTDEAWNTIRPEGYPDLHLTVCQHGQPIETRVRRYRDFNLCWNWVIGGRVLLYMVLYTDRAVRVVWNRLERDRTGMEKWQAQSTFELKPGEHTDLGDGWTLRCEPLAEQLTLFSPGL